MGNFHSIDEGINALKKGEILIVVDDEKRENEGDFLLAGEFITPEKINFLSTVGKGLICAPISSKIAKQFELNYMVAANTSEHHTAFTVSIDAKEGTTTGISASDRSKTIEVLCDEKAPASSMLRPGHIFPLIAKEGGVLVRPGHTEASVDLMKIAGLKEVAVICEIIGEDGSMLRGEALFDLAKKYDFKIITILDLIHYKKQHENYVKKVDEVKLPTKYGEFTIDMFNSSVTSNDDMEKLPIVIRKGEIKRGNPLLVRVHSECFTGDILGSLRCDCGDQLQESLKLINENESGIVIYMRQEGRGIGLINKLKAYKLQEQGLDTYEANLKLGFSPDARDYFFAYQILKYYGVHEIKLISNNPAKINELTSLGINVIERIDLKLGPNEHNYHYLLTKKEKFGHFINDFLN
ncbi:MAG: 3,4-dihydroxy-2-butanone-4-phosphate synthase [Bacteriovoracaceae bacterium]